MGEVIVITSGKGGVGKTTTVANLGAALAKNGKSVLLADADIGLRNLDVVLGLENQIVYDLVDVIEQKCRLRQAFVQDRRYPSLYLLAASQTKDKAAVTPAQMQTLCKDLRERFDYVLLDCPAGIEQGFANAVAGADKAVVVTTPFAAAIRDADRIIGRLEQYELAATYLLINRVRPSLIASGSMLDTAEIVETLAIELLGVVPDDDRVLIAANSGALVAEDEKSIAGKAFCNAARRLCGETVPPLKLCARRTFGSRLKKIFKTE